MLKRVFDVAFGYLAGVETTHDVPKQREKSRTNYGARSICTPDLLKQFWAHARTKLPSLGRAEVQRVQTGL